MNIEPIGAGGFLEKISPNDPIFCAGGPSGYIERITNETFTISLIITIPDVKVVTHNLQKVNSFFLIKTEEAIVLLSISKSGDVTVVRPQRIQ
ncbi:MAG: hypothetical protein PHE24_04360 [Patescibacteria group bacterium]|nr:hypothetical protein [Patescibacteria group bacterium]